MINGRKEGQGRASNWLECGDTGSLCHLRSPCMSRTLMFFVVKLCTELNLHIPDQGLSCWVAQSVCLPAPPPSWWFPRVFHFTIIGPLCSWEHSKYKNSFNTVALIYSLPQFYCVTFILYKGAYILQYHSKVSKYLGKWETASLIKSNKIFTL